MKLLFKLLGAILFVIFFGFSLKNTQEVSLRFFWDYEVRGPLILMLFFFFIGGVVLGILAMASVVFRHRRDLSAHKKMLAELKKEHEQQQRTHTQPPMPDSVAS